MVRDDRYYEALARRLARQERGRARMSTKVEAIPMLLWCPMCNTRHVDEGEFATKEHHTHACQHCGAVWRPAIVPTKGVRFLPGFQNERCSECAGTGRWSWANTTELTICTLCNGTGKVQLAPFGREAPVNQLTPADVEVIQKSTPCCAYAMGMEGGSRCEDCYRRDYR